MRGDEKIEQKESLGNIEKLKLELENLNKKSEVLLNGYLNQVIDPETYKTKKNEMFETKLKFQEEITKVEDTDSSWLELMREFINVAINCDKIARAKNNCEELAFFAKRVGSNFFFI